MSDTLDHLEWAINTIREKLTFGMDELSAARSREHRAKGAMIAAKKELEALRLENERLKRQLDCRYEHPHFLLEDFVCNKCGFFRKGVSPITKINKGSE